MKIHITVCEVDTLTFVKKSQSCSIYCLDFTIPERILFLKCAYTITILTCCCSCFTFGTRSISKWGIYYSNIIQRFHECHTLTLLDTRWQQWHNVELASFTNFTDWRIVLSLHAFEGLIVVINPGEHIIIFLSHLIQREQDSRH